MLVLHIGYAKSATTFLQKHVFSNLPGVNYIGRYYGECRSSRIDEDIIYDFVFEDSDSTQIFANNILDSMTDKHKYTMISHEVLLRPYKKYRLLQRIKDLDRYFKGIKLIVSIRNQIDIVLSRHVHDRKIIPHFSISDALDYDGITECKWPLCSRDSRGTCACKLAGVKFINIPFYNYLDLYCLLSSMFGSENIHFVVSENLRSFTMYEIDRMTQFLEVKKMDRQFLQSLGEKRENVHRNQSLYDEIKKDFTCTGEKGKVFEYFKEANKVLAGLLQQDLETHGYY
jgi:hypothetical protein